MKGLVLTFFLTNSKHDLIRPLLSHTRFLLLLLIPPGDFTIGEKYQAVSGQGVPNQSGGFVDISLEFKSVCVVTRNQPPLSSFASSPSCQYEFDMRFCRNSHSNCRQGTFSAHGSGPDKIRIAGGADDFFGAFGQVCGTPLLNTTS